jgi:hypothetical protein
MSEQPPPTVTPPKPLDDSPQSIRFFEPEKLRFWRTPGGVVRMEVEGECSCLKVVVARAFPLSHPDEYLSLRDGNKKELGMLRRLRDVPKEARRLLEEEIDRRYFLPRIDRIEQIRERFGIAEWEVVTSRGPRKFVTKSVHDSVIEPEPNRYLVTDVDGNRYEIADLTEMEPTSAKRLSELL